MKRGATAVALGLVLTLVPVAGASAGDAAARRAPSTIDLTASDDVVRFGRSVRLVAALTGPPGGQAILIERLAGGDPTVIGGCVTGDAGRCSVAVKPRRGSTYRAAFAGAGSWDPATSAPVTVRVRADVDGKLRGADDRSGRYHLYRRSARVTFLADVAPRRRGQRVSFPLEFNYGHGWTDGGTSSFRTDGDGSVLIYFASRALPVGAYRIRAVTRSARGVLGGRSELVYFRVRA
jgi:hypothetical protein